MISSTKVLCFVAIAFADSDFRPDHDAVMRELSERENQGLATIEEQRELADAIEDFRELVGDTEESRELVGETEEFRELADAISDEEREVFFRRWKKKRAASAKARRCKANCKNFTKTYMCRSYFCRIPNREKRWGCIRKCEAKEKRKLARCQSRCGNRQLDEEVSAAVLV